MRIVFMGTPAFAATSLGALLSSGCEVAGVWTRADKPHGRGRHLAPSPVKEMAESRGIQVYQPRTLRHPDAASEVARLAPDVICVAAYGLILPPAVLAIPRLGCVNVHASLLPRYRGAAPIHRAIMAGEVVTGITTMMMDEGLDTGDILLMEKEPIGPDDTTGELENRLASLGAELLLETLTLLGQGRCPRVPQEPAQATYARPVTRDDCRIDWTAPASTIHQLVRGTNPRPGAFTTRAGNVLRVHRTQILGGTQAGVPGAPVYGSETNNTESKNLVIGCGSGAVKLLTVQPAGKKAMSGADYLRGYPFQPNERLG